VGDKQPSSQHEAPAPDSGASPDFPVAILAGGRATRLGPIAGQTPKLLLEVAGEPFLSHQIRLLKGAGLTRLVLCVGHLAEQIVGLCGDGSRWGVRIDYSFDGPRLLGTGGAIIRALPRLGAAFYVLYGDSYLPIDYRLVGKAFLQSGKLGLMTVFENRGLYDSSNVWFENGAIRVYDKARRLPEMRHIDYGLGVFRAAAFAGFPADEPADLADIQKALVARGELAGFEVSRRFYEIGSPAGLEELDRLLRRDSRTTSAASPKDLTT
jgi:NDP-sugar pyrophosphorylase family protein